MKTKLSRILMLIVILIIGLLILTGCGTSNTIVDNLNNVVDSELAEWQEQGYGRSFTMYLMQQGLSSINPAYVIVASGEKEFTVAPDITEYEEGEIANYEGTGYSYTRMMEGSSAATNLVILDTTTKKYYNVQISYQEFDLNGAKKEYPVFSNAKEIK